MSEKWPFPDLELVERARQAMGAAYAPYSGFRVGAALITAGGEIFTGCNIENSSYGLTCCAERVAVFKAVSAGHKEFAGLAVISGGADYCSPCGACRQVLAEFAPDMPVLMCNDRGEYQAEAVRELLPRHFSLRPSSS